MKVRFINKHSGPVSLPGPLPRLQINSDVTVDIAPEEYDRYREEIQSLVNSNRISQEFVDIVGSFPGDYTLDQDEGKIRFRGTPIAPSAGGVIGPGGGAVDGNLAAFDGPSGLVIKDSGAATTSIPTPAQKDALAGTSGAPSDTNRYVTNADPRNTNARPPTGAAGGDLGLTYPNPNVVAVHESGGQRLPVGAVADGQVLTRVGASLVGSFVAGPFEDDPPTNVNKSAAVAGVIDQAARGDHKHDVDTGTPGAILIGDTAAEGTSTALARADHKHAFALPAPSNPLNVNKSPASAGTSTSPARADHKHDVDTATPVNVDKSTAAEGTATSLARSDHKHDISTGVPGVQQLATPASEGSATSLARSNHTHLISVTGPAALVAGGPQVVGTSVAAVRGDHIHAAPTAAPVNVTKAANAEGVATSFARSDHKHDVSTGTPGTTQIANAAAEGTATTLARSDHVHAVGTPGAPANVTKAAAAAGTSTTPAREDHKHDVLTAAPVTTGQALAEGVSTALARADHVHTTTLASQHAAAVTNATLASAATPTLITGLSITAGFTGTYFMISSLTLTSNNSNNAIEIGIYINGVLIEDTHRNFDDVDGTFERTFATQVAGISVTAGDTIEVRYTSTGSTTYHHRGLCIIKTAP